MTIETETETKPQLMPSEPVIDEQRFMIDGVGWQGYQGLLQIIGNRLPRLTYAHHDVELMKPGFLHERYRAVLGRVVSTITEELDLPVMSLGATTLNREDRDCGLEFDDAYYLTNIRKVCRKQSIEFGVDPPPNLGIEIAISKSELNRLDIAARLDIPEVWRFDGNALKVFRSDEGGQFLASETSLAFPFLPIKELERLITDYDLGDDSRWGRLLRIWVRDVLLPIYRDAARPESTHA